MGPFLEWIRATNGRTARRLLVGAVGGAMALAGIALLVLPGPGIPLLLAGNSIIHAAFESGYESHSAYSVAFKKLFGVSPSRFTL